MQNEVKQTGGVVIPFPAPSTDLEPDTEPPEGVLEDWAQYLQRVVIPRLDPGSELWRFARQERRAVARGALQRRAERGEE